MKYSLIILVITSAGMLLSGCSSSKELQSSYSDKIVIDGQYQEWGNSIIPMKDENVGIGFENNNDFLYLAIVSTDRNTIRKIAGNGLTIWLETDKGKLGIRYPMKMDESEMMQMRLRQIGGESDRKEITPADLLKGREDLQVINEDGLPLYTSRADAGESFKAKINLERDQLIYEMQIPLRSNDITSRIFTRDIKDVEIQFKTNEIERPRMRGNPPGEEGPQSEGERGGMGGMRPGGMRPGGMGMDRDFKPIDLSFKIHLQSK